MLIKKIIQLFIKIFIICFVLISILVLIPLSVGLGIKYIDYIPFFNEVPGDNGDWLGFWSGYLGSIIGIGGAYYVMKHQLTEENKKELKDKKPLLVVGTNEYTNLSLIPGRDIINEGKWVHNLGNFSDAVFPLVNGGTTPVFDIKYSYTINNFDKYKNLYKKNSKHITEDHGLSIDSNEINEEIIENLYYNYVSSDSDGEFRKRLKILKNTNYVDFASVIMPGESINLRMPLTATVLVNYSFFNYFKYTENGIDRLLLPELTLKVSYKDYELKDRTKLFQIRINEYDSSVSNARFRISSNLKEEA